MYLFRFSKDGLASLNKNGFVPKIQSHHIHQLIESYRERNKTLPKEQLCIFNHGIWIFFNNISELPYPRHYRNILLNHLDITKEYKWWIGECPDNTRIYTGIDYDARVLTMERACMKDIHDGFLSSQDYIVSTFQEFHLK